MDLATARQHAHIGVSSLITRAAGRFYAGAVHIVDPQDVILKTLEVKEESSHLLVLHVQKTTGAEYILAIVLNHSTSLIQCSQGELSAINQKCITHHFPDQSTVAVIVYYSDAMSVLS